MFGVIGGGGSDDMFVNSLVVMVGVLCLPFLQRRWLGITYQGERGLWDELHFRIWGNILEFPPQTSEGSEGNSVNRIACESRM